MSFEVSAVAARDWRQLRDTRLRALSTDPDAFGGTYQESAGLGQSVWQSRAEASEHGVEYRWFAATKADGQWVGMALAAANAGSPDAHLFGMWVAPQARGNGLAGLLCDACADWATEHGYTGIALEVVLSNQRAASAYTKAGFVAVEERLGKRDLPVTVMRRAT